MDTKDQVDKSLVKFSGEWTDRAKADKREHLGTGGWVRGNMIIMYMMMKRMIHTYEYIY